MYPSSSHRSLILSVVSSTSPGQALAPNIPRGWAKLVATASSGLFPQPFLIRWVYEKELLAGCAGSSTTVTNIGIILPDVKDKLIVDRDGIEPPTHGFSVHCSTN